MERKRETLQDDWQPSNKKQTLQERRDAAWNRYFSSALGSRRADHALAAVRRLAIEH